MTKPIIRIHDISTNEIIDRQMNDEEFAVYTKEQEVKALAKAEEAKQATAKAALLDKLGITEEEAKLLLL